MYENKLNIAIGEDYQGNKIYFDLLGNQHVLIAGSTGSGKDTFLCSFLYMLMNNNDSENLRFVLVDNTRVVLSSFNNTKYLLAPMVTDMEQVPNLFKWLLEETERRFNTLIEEKVRNIDELNNKKSEIVFPRIVVLIRELAEVLLVNPSEIEKNVLKLTQLTKAVGIHLIIGVQRPTSNVITGLIKANIPARMAFYTPSAASSTVILDKPGAEKLEGKGDMLLLTRDISDPIRLRSYYIKESTIDSYVASISTNNYDSDLWRYLQNGK